MCSSDPFPGKEKIGNIWGFASHIISITNIQCCHCGTKVSLHHMQINGAQRPSDTPGPGRHAPPLNLGEWRLLVCITLHDAAWPSGQAEPQPLVCPGWNHRRWSCRTWCVLRWNHSMFKLDFILRTSGQLLCWANENESSPERGDDLTRVEQLSGRAETKLRVSWFSFRSLSIPPPAVYFSARVLCFHFKANPVG